MILFCDRGCIGAAACLPKYDLQFTKDACRYTSYMFMTYRAGHMRAQPQKTQLLDAHSRLKQHRILRLHLAEVLVSGQLGKVFCLRRAQIAIDTCENIDHWATLRSDVRVEPTFCLLVLSSTLSLPSASCPSQE
jgi:hypothetical protein